MVKTTKWPTSHPSWLIISEYFLFPIIALIPPSFLSSIQELLKYSIIRLLWLPDSIQSRAKPHFLKPSLKIIQPKPRWMSSFLTVMPPCSLPSVNESVNQVQLHGSLWLKHVDISKHTSSYIFLDLHASHRFAYSVAWSPRLDQMWVWIHLLFLLLL